MSKRQILGLVCMIGSILSNPWLLADFLGDIPRWKEVVVLILLFELLFFVSGIVLWFGRKTPQFVQNMFLIYGSIFFTYLVVETIFFIGTGFYYIQINDQISLNALSRRCIAFDAVRGYRWISGESRWVRVTGGTLVFDEVFRSNNVGYVSSRDFFYKKKSPHTKRIMLLGDSFAAGEYITTPLSDKLHEVLNETYGEKDETFEVYSFAYSGIGLGNWHSIFLNEIVQHYEFDGLIIASFLSDLGRDFVMAHADEDHFYFGSFPTPPQSKEKFEIKYIPKMSKIGQVIEEQKLNETISQVRKREWRRPQFDLYAGKFVFNRLRHLLGHDGLKKENKMIARSSQTVVQYSPWTRQELEKRYPAGNLNKLWDILNYCVQHKIPVLFASVPSKIGATLQARQKDRSMNEYQLELWSIAQLYEFPYFDGYWIFSDLEPQDIDDYWLIRDGHWNQRGSDYFAKHLAAYVAQKWHF